MGQSLLSNKWVQRIREFACGHGAPAITARLPSRLLTKPNKCVSDTDRTRHLQTPSSIMDASFERMLAQAVRGNQGAGPPQEPTVPDKCVLPHNLILLPTRSP
jgi:hypothetical protein